MVLSYSVVIGICAPQRGAGGKGGAHHREGVRVGARHCKKTHYCVPLTLYRIQPYTIKTDSELKHLTYCTVLLSYIRMPFLSTVQYFSVCNNICHSLLIRQPVAL
jgi:hypothetical protein